MLENTRGALYICMSSSELHTLYSAFTQSGEHWSTFLIWGKNTFTLGRSDYQRQFEPILYGWPERASHYWCGARVQGDLWMIDPPVKLGSLPASTAAEVSKSAEKVVQSVASVKLPSGQGLVMSELLDKRRRAIETQDLDVRIQKLEVNNEPEHQSSN